jgi:branched-subunit amino acid ABC-type transport system permease component
MFTGHVQVIGRPFPIYSFFLLGLAALVAALLWALVYRTPLGRTIRSAVSDPTLLRLSGVNVRWLFTAVFAIGALLAGLAGAVTVPPGSVTIGVDVQVIVRAFAIIVIGGLGSLSGALVGALLVGLADSLGLLWWSNGALAFPYIVLVVVLIVRPYGLFRTARA